MKERKYIKLRTDMYSDTKFKIIDTKPERDLIHYVWMRLVILAGKCNQEGELYMSRTIPYTVETLSIEFGRGYAEVKGALDLLMGLEMIEFTEEKVFKVKNFAKHQNIKAKDNFKTEDRNNIKEDVLKNNEIQVAKEKEFAQNQSTSVTTNNKFIVKDTEDTLKGQKIHEKNNFIEAKEIELQNIKKDVHVKINKNTPQNTCENINEPEVEVNLQEKNLKFLKVKNNNKGRKKITTQDITSFDFEENNEEQIDGFHDGEIPLGKGERVVWELAKSCEG